MEMVKQARSETARAEGTPRVDVDRSREGNQPEAPDPEPLGDWKLEEERVGSAALGDSL